MNAKGPNSGVVKEFTDSSAHFGALNQRQKDFVIEQLVIATLKSALNAPLSVEEARAELESIVRAAGSLKTF